MKTFEIRFVCATKPVTRFQDVHFPNQKASTNVAVYASLTFISLVFSVFDGASRGMTRVRSLQFFPIRHEDVSENRGKRASLTVRFNLALLLRTGKAKEFVFFLTFASFNVVTSHRSPVRPVEPSKC